MAAAGDQKDDWLAVRMEDLDHGGIDGICAAARACPLTVSKDAAPAGPLRSQPAARQGAPARARRRPAAVASRGTARRATGQRPAGGRHRGLAAARAHPVRARAADRPEREVLALMATGRSSNAIARRLFVTGHTIGKHVENICVSLRMPASPHDRRRVLAVLACLSAGYPPPGQHAGNGRRRGAPAAVRSLAAPVSQAPRLFPLTWKEA